MHQSSRICRNSDPNLGAVEVLQLQNGLVMQPIRNTSKGDAQGYGMPRAHDLEASMAMALVDLALETEARVPDCQAYCEAQTNALQKTDEDVLCRGEAPCVNMETF